MTGEIKAGDIVWANPWNKYIWNAEWWARTHSQPFRVEEVRRQTTGPVLVLRGLWSDVREIGGSPQEYRKLKRERRRLDSQ